MSVVNFATEPVTCRDILRRANLAWWRAGVTRGARRELTDDLRDELRAATADGVPLDQVVGENGSEMFRDWASERGLTGRAHRLVIVTPLALVAVLSGLAVPLILVYSGFHPESGGPMFDASTAVTFALYASAGVLALLCSLVSVGLTLRWIGDPHAAASVTWLAILLPAGGALSVGAGVGAAWLSDFRPTSAVAATVTVTAVAVLILTVGLARHLAVRDTGPASARGMLTSP